jgi:transposase
MSHVPQINSLVRLKHSFLHLLKRLAPTSPDLSAIENIWRILSNNMYRDPEPRTLAYLKRRLRQAWKAVTPDTLTNLMNSMPGRMRDVIKMKGNTVR